MEKVCSKQTIFSKFVNFCIKLNGSKWISSSEDKTKRYISKYSKKKMKEYIYNGFNKEKIEDVIVYSYNKNKSNNKILLYVHGGSFIEHASYFQIKFAKKIAKKTNSILMVPIYDLLPFGNALKMFDSITKVYKKILEINPSEINFLGDSAGGGTILSYSMFLRDKNVKGPKNIIMLSPWLDLSMTNPNILKDEKKDVMNGLAGTKYAGKLWAFNLNIYDYKVSPMYGNFNSLGKITLIFGGCEILTSECLKFHDLLNKENIEHNFIIYEKEGHDFAAYPTREGKIVISDIAKIIGD